MPTNIEIKARVADAAGVRAAAAAISDTAPETLVQRDTFFPCPHGRLKLREIESGRSELIWYDRPTVAGSKTSEYLIADVADASGLRELLRLALGAGRVVEKTRTLCRVGQTRIHLDRVAGLGDFLELEVVLQPGQAEAEGHAIAADLMRRLGIDGSDLVGCSYAELPAGST